MGCVARRRCEEHSALSAHNHDYVKPSTQSLNCELPLALLSLLFVLPSLPDKVCAWPANRMSL